MFGGSRIRSNFISVCSTLVLVLAHFGSSFPLCICNCCESHCCSGAACCQSDKDSACCEASCCSTASQSCCCASTSEHDSTGCECGCCFCFCDFETNFLKAKETRLETSSGLSGLYDNLLEIYSLKPDESYFNIPKHVCSTPLRLHAILSVWLN